MSVNPKEGRRPRTKQMSADLYPGEAVLDHKAANHCLVLSDDNNNNNNNKSLETST